MNYYVFYRHYFYINIDIINKSYYNDDYYVKHNAWAYQYSMCIHKNDNNNDINEFYLFLDSTYYDICILLIYINVYMHI